MSVLIGGLLFLICVTIILGRPDFDIKSRIVNGNNENNGKNYLASIRLGNTGVHVPNTVCGGAIIDSTVVLTAAHCFQGNNYPTDYYTIGVGSLDLASVRTYAVQEIIVHESYDEQTASNDIAVVRVEEMSFDGVYVNILGISVLIDQPVAPISFSSSNTQTGSQVLSAGLDLTNPLSIIFQQKQLQVMDLQECANSLASVNLSSVNIFAGNICASPISGDACAGDSSGLLVSNNILIGIGSFGFQCNSVFTSVAYYRSWIDAKKGI